jgi:hypothetical protein
VTWPETGDAAPAQTKTAAATNRQRRALNLRNTPNGIRAPYPIGSSLSKAICALFCAFLYDFHAGNTLQMILNNSIRQLGADSNGVAFHRSGCEDRLRRFALSTPAALLKLGLSPAAQLPGRF